MDPMITIETPTTPEYSGSMSMDIFEFNINVICCINKENLTTTKPKPMIPKLVVIQAKNVRSLAKWSLIFSVLFFSIIR